MVYIPMRRAAYCIWIVQGKLAEHNVHQNCSGQGAAAVAGQICSERLLLSI